MAYIDLWFPRWLLPWQPLWSRLNTSVFLHSFDIIFIMVKFSEYVSNGSVLVSRNSDCLFKCGLFNITIKKSFINIVIIIINTCTLLYIFMFFTCTCKYMTCTYKDKTILNNVCVCTGTNLVFHCHMFHLVYYCHIQSSRLYSLGTLSLPFFCFKIELGSIVL